jgi:hypothetical protein
VALVGSGGGRRAVGGVEDLVALERGLLDGPPTPASRVCHRKTFDDVARQRGPLAHDTNDIKRQQPFNHGLRIGEVVLKNGDVRSLAEYRPIGALKRRILVIVQNSNLVRFHGIHSR